MCIMSAGEETSSFVTTAEDEGKLSTPSPSRRPEKLNEDYQSFILQCLGKDTNQPEIFQIIRISMQDTKLMAGKTADQSKTCA